MPQLRAGPSSQPDAAATAADPGRGGEPSGTSEEADDKTVRDLLFSTLPKHCHRTHMLAAKLY